MLPALVRDSGPKPCDYIVATRLSFKVRYKLRPDLRLAGWKRHFAARVRPIANETIAEFRKYENRLNIAASACIEAMEETGITPEPARIADYLFLYFYPQLASVQHPIRRGLREEKMKMLCWFVAKNKIRTTACS
jgi:hypothetical protein